ncbi:hypothetical protein B0H14DRAFT_458362 [Mycena olivaceomarginata]|nr:hypothetical protein B0H14DRAFT_458362 [Mycena olivaceomarginata]
MQARQLRGTGPGSARRRHLPRHPSIFQHRPATPKINHQHRFKCIESRAQLTDLIFTYRSPDTTLDILAQCVNLTSASISTQPDHGLTAPQARRDLLTLRHLHVYLAFFASAVGPAGPFLGCLSAPALEELCLDFNVFQMPSQWTAALLEFQLRSPHYPT